ncbi:MAG: hypothetical protein OXL68_01485 [Paracoccaceae bacterium]|nr:hypothetical protein [Paracoccaceae bacterium]
MRLTRIGGQTAIHPIPDESESEAGPVVIELEFRRSAGEIQRLVTRPTVFDVDLLLCYAHRRG